MSKKGTITSRTLEKLGFSGFRFRSNTQPGTQEELERKKGLSDNADKTQTSVTTITGGELEIPEKPQKKTLKEKLLGSKFGGEDKQSSKKSPKKKLNVQKVKKESASNSVFYIDQPNELETRATNADTSAQTVEYNTMQEKKKKVQPEGTQEYEVQDRDTLEKIAAHFDTTPSELKKINKLISTMIFAKQILYVPDKDYVSTRASVSSMEESSNTSISPFGSPLNKPAMDIPLIKAVNSSPTRIPGHAERLTSVSSTKDEDFDIIPPHKLSEDEVQQLDQDCMERFIKLNVKHITDGQGVVKGVLLVTPNAVMFDPDVSDALVLEHGAEKYGMIAPMDLIISAAMYHDIAAMKLRGTVMEDGSLYPKPEVYRDKEHCCQKHVQDTSANLQSQPGPECSCYEGETVMSVSDDENGKTLGIDRVTEEFSKLKTDLDDICDAGGNTDKTDDTSDVFIDHVDSHFDNSNEESESKETRGPKLQKGQKKLSVSFSLPDSDSLNDKQTEATKADKPDEAESDNNDVVNLDDHSVHHMKEIVEEENGKCADEEDKKTRIGSIVYLPVEDDSNGQVSLEALTETQKTLSEMSNSKFEETSKSDSNLADSVATKTENKNVEKTRSSSTSSLGPFSPTPHLNAFVNYATGFFQRNPSDSSIKDMKDVIQDSVEELKKSDITTIFGGSPKPGKRRGKMSRNTDLAHMEVAVESAVTMDEKPDLLTMDYDSFAPRKSVTFPDPPLYLCLRLGTPQNKNVFQHNYSNEAYGKRRKKSEYWFSIPRDKVDHLYAFFVQWSPQIYGDADEISAEARGFVVFEEGVDEEGLEVLDEHFGPHSNFHKDWEIISKDEYRRRSIVFDIPLPLPELIGESNILEDEHIRDISQNMPGRTVGYPWTLIYSTDKHGFSLKTLYRDMQGLDSPVLLVVKDTNDQVFGALTSCELKYSDHFYGTGESFLFTFYPEFKVFNWTGENNFFIKGNKESLTIGAGQGVFGLWFDEDLYHGRTNKCETFDNDLLTINEDFVVKGFEGWAFMWDSNC